MLLLEHAFHKGEQGLITHFTNRERLGNGRHDLLRITHRSERHYKHSVGEQLA